MTDGKRQKIKGKRSKERSKEKSKPTKMDGTTFEDLGRMAKPAAWDIRERSFEFACDVVRFCLKLNAKRELRSIADQLLRSGTGIASNAEEAKGAYSRRIFAVKNSYALSEARESQLWLRLIVHCELCDDLAEGRRLLQESGELVGILHATVRSARRTV